MICAIFIVFNCGSWTLVQFISVLTATQPIPSPSPLNPHQQTAAYL